MDKLFFRKQSWNLSATSTHCECRQWVKEILLLMCNSLEKSWGGFSGFSMVWSSLSTFLRGVLLISPNAVGFQL